MDARKIINRDPKTQRSPKLLSDPARRAFSLSLRHLIAWHSHVGSEVVHTAAEPATTAHKLLSLATQHW